VLGAYDHHLDRSGSLRWRGRGKGQGEGDEGGGRRLVARGGRRRWRATWRGRRRWRIPQRIAKKVEPLDPTTVGVREGRKPSEGVYEGLRGRGHNNWSKDWGRSCIRRKRVSCYFLGAQDGGKIQRRGVVVNGLVTGGVVGGRLSLDWMIRGGWNSSPGLVPSGAPLGLAPGTRHIEGESWAREGADRA
jgi:hypothetical protein